MGKNKSKKAKNQVPRYVVRFPQGFFLYDSWKNVLLDSGNGFPAGKDVKASVAFEKCYKAFLHMTFVDDRDIDTELYVPPTHGKYIDHDIAEKMCSDMEKIHHNWIFHLKENQRKRFESKSRYNRFSQTCTNKVVDDEKMCSSTSLSDTAS